MVRKRYRVSKRRPKRYRSRRRHGDFNWGLVFLGFVCVAVLLYPFYGSVLASFIPSPFPSVTPAPSPTPPPNGGGNSPTPTPAPPVGDNLAPMFQVTPSLVQWGDYHLFGDVCYGDPAVYEQISHVDKTVLHDGHWSIRIDAANSVNTAREINEHWKTVSVGNTVTMSCWIKTASQPFWETAGPGAIAGFDFYGANGRIGEVHPRTIQDEVWAVGTDGRPVDGWEMVGDSIYVPYGSDWTRISLTVTIPDTVYTYDYWTGSGWATTTGKVVGIIPWIGCSWNNGETASGWFADAELYINP